MSTSRRTPLEWFRAVATEMFVVVISILLAFQVDEWREAADRSETLSLVSDRLGGDLQTDAEVLRTRIESSRAMAARIADAIPLVRKGPPFSASEAAVLRNALESDFLFQGFYTPAGYELLVSQGLMMRLPSVDLQSALIERAVVGGRLEDRRAEILENMWLREASEYFTVGVAESEGPRPLALRYDFDAIRSGDSRLQAALLEASNAQNFWASTLEGQMRRTLRADSLLSASR